MLILSQDGKSLINADNVTEFYIDSDYPNEVEIKASLINEDFSIILGVYYSLEVAKHVLELIFKTQTSFKMPANKVVMEVLNAKQI